MDEHLARIERIYPDSKFVKIQKYNEAFWKDRTYTSSLDEKAALNKWSKNPLNYEQAQEAVEKGYRVGWIVPKGFVVVDIDNEDNPKSQLCVEHILRKFECKYSYNYTSRGIHILFVDPKGEIKSVSKEKCGLNVEIDTRANGTGYIVLPCNDPHRRWGEWNDFVEDIPYFLVPFTKTSTESFIGMTEGDGRNTALFKWRTVLENKSKMTEKQIENTIRTINENLFDVPMPNNELFKTVLRSKDKGEAKTEKENVYNKIADEIILKYDIVYSRGRYYMFNGIYYKKCELIEIERIIHNEINHNLNSAARNEIMNFLKIKAFVSSDLFDKDWYKIAVRNGTLNLVTGEVDVPTKNDLNTIYIDYEYDDDPPYSQTIDEFFKQLSDGDINRMQFLYEIVGYCLLKKNLFEKFFIFKGEGGTGKSTYLNLIQKLIGADFVANIALSDMNKDYYLANLASKLVNFDDDVQDTKALKDSGRFKSIVSGNKISARRIYEDIITFVPFCTCIFSCNKLPKISDNTTGLFRRMIILKLNNKIEHPDPLFLQRITETDMEYLFFKAVEAIRIAIERGRFTINESEEDMLREYKRNQSAVTNWVYDNDYCAEDFVNKKSLAMYGLFKNWAENMGYKTVPTQLEFREQICMLYNLKTELRSVEDGQPRIISFQPDKNYRAEYKPF